ncbi:MAG: hypothetical protein M3R00_03045, partial [Pseudomonadota bacterium]|nr:hypothetical protein [Pseudomonadota bacterium]
EKEYRGRRIQKVGNCTVKSLDVGRQIRFGRAEGDSNTNTTLYKTIKKLEIAEVERKIQLSLFFETQKILDPSTAQKSTQEAERLILNNN